MALCHEQPFVPPHRYPVWSPSRRPQPRHPSPPRTFLAEAALLERIQQALLRLRGQGRHCVFILDAQAGNGQLLIHVARQAEVLGFTAIDATGIDVDAGHVADARRAASVVRNPAMSLAFVHRLPAVTAPFDDDTFDLVIAGVADPASDLAHLIGRDGEVIVR